MKPLDEMVQDIVLTTEPLALNEMALSLGLEYNAVKRDAADREAHRTVLRARIEQRLRDSGAATSDKAAERLAKEDEAYCTYCDDLARLERQRDDLEVLYKAAYQRAWLLAPAAREG